MLQANTGVHTTNKITIKQRVVISYLLAVSCMRVGLQVIHVGSRLEYLANGDLSCEVKVRARCPGSAGCSVRSATERSRKFRGA